jgi:membrane protein DedA with SNARE-associated domain
MLIDLASWRAALDGLAAPGVIAIALALTTLLVEDLAIAAGAALATQGTISWELAFVAVGGGIAAGDLGLYALGALARRFAWLERRYGGARALELRERLERCLVGAVLLARVIPGLRLLTYTASGFLRLNLAAFTVWVVIAVSAWTAGLFVLAGAFGHWLAATLPIPAPLAVALPIVAFALVVPWWQRARRMPNSSFEHRSGSSS